jgi:hypothetical protein
MTWKLGFIGTPDVQAIGEFFGKNSNSNSFGLGMRMAAKRNNLLV